MLNNIIIYIIIITSYYYYFVYYNIHNVNINLVLDVAKVEANFKMKPVIKNKDTYLEIEKLTWKFIPLKMHLRLDNLFNGDKVLGNL